MLLLPPTNTLSSASLPNKEVTQADVNEVDTSSYLRSSSMQAADAHQLAINRYGRNDCEQVMDIAVPNSMVGSGGQTGMAGLGHGETLDMHKYCTGCAAPGVVGGGGTFGEMEMVVEDQLCFGVVECLAPEIHLQQLEMDRLIATHVEEVKREFAEKRNRQWEALLAAAEETVSYYIRAKQAEIEAIGRLNQSLESHIAALSLQNQLWRELARSNEAAARGLRTNLDQAAEPAASFTGSSDSAADRRCRVCGSAESRVLILPCRHLWLCGSCGASVDVCPVCDSDKTVTINVNMCHPQAEPAV